MAEETRMDVLSNPSFIAILLDYLLHASCREGHAARRLKEVSVLRVSAELEEAVMRVGCRGLTCHAQKIFPPALNIKPGPPPRVNTPGRVLFDSHDPKFQAWLSRLCGNVVSDLMQ